MGKAELPKFWIDYSAHELMTRPYAIFPWSMSVTGAYSQEELTFLRDADVGWIAENIIGADTAANTDYALDEYVGHGYLRKGALLARQLVKLDPDAEGYIKELYSDTPYVAEDLLYTNLDLLAASPSELKVYERIEYVL